MERTLNGLNISDMELNMIGYFQVRMKTANDNWYVMDGSSACGPHQAVEIIINGVSFVPAKRLIMSIQWLPFNIKTAPRNVSLLFYAKFKIESGDINAPEFYYESDMGMIEEEDGRLVIKYDNCDSNWFIPTHYAEINWPDD